MSYIGNSPGNASQRVVTRKVATAGQTRFASDSGYATGYVDVIVNGSDLVAGVDFNETGDGINIDLVEACAADDNVKIVAYIPRGLSDGYTKPEANALLALKADLVAGKIPSSQLPAYVDDVLEYANLAAFPATGSAGIIYVAQDTNNCYRWSGSAYIVLTDLSAYYTKTQSDAMLVPSVVSDKNNTSTGYFDLPSGTTAERPASPAAGYVRFNTTLSVVEIYTGTAWASVSIMLDGSTAALAPTSASALISAGKGSNGLYYIKPDASGVAKQMYCYLNTFGPWVVIGRSASAINTYTHAPGFYDNGVTPTPSQNGSLSLFAWSDAYVNNNTLFRFYDTVYGNWVEFYVENLTSIKAAPDTFIATDDAFKIRFVQQSSPWNTSSSLNQFCRLASYQGLSNVPGFGVGSATSPIGLYGKTLYYATTSEGDKRGFEFSNGSGYEGAYGSAGLQRYNPTPYYAGGNILLLMKV